MKSHAKVVVIGGGVVGCSVLFHLTRMGWSDVVLVERDELTGGSTWHAAGNCPSFSGSWSVMKLQHYSNRLYERLGEEVDYPINYHRTGSVRLAHTRDRMAELRHVQGMAEAQGLAFEMLGPKELKERYPFVELHDLEGALWDPTDGDIDPSQLTQAFAKGARDKGAEIVRKNPVEAIRRSREGEWKVETAQGTITCEIVVNAAGYRGAEVGALVGLDLPIVSMEHQYLVSEAIPALAERGEKLPLLRDPDVSYYLRQERDGLLLGPYEWEATPCWVEQVPRDFGMELFPDKLDRLEWYIEQAMERVPLLAEAGIQRVINGPIPYTPDGNPLIGPAYPLKNFYNCCGFSFGIVQGGGAGKLMAEILVEGEPEWDIWGLDPRRYTAYATKGYTAARAVELYQNEYAMSYPGEERAAGRPARTTPLYALLKGKGAQFGARGGWERATWFARNGEAPAEPVRTLGRGPWHDAVAEECRAVRERVGVLDLGGFAKFEVKGQGAYVYLDHLVCGALPKPGRVSLSYFCNPRGHILSEVTIAHLGDNHFYLCGAATGEWHDHQWLLEHLPKEGVGLDVVTNAYGTLVLAGPRARDVLARLTTQDLSNAAFPWMSVRELVIGSTRVRALRVSYTGELGWELHVPTEGLLPVYEAVMAAGADQGIADFGLYALDSLRLEKAYRSWKVDLVQEVTPLEAGLERFVRLDKEDFIGRSALLRQQQEGVPQRLVPLLLEPGEAGAEDAEWEAPFCAGVFKNGDRVGLVGSSGYGHTLGRSIALAYVRQDLAVPGETLEVDLYGFRRAAEVVQEPPYDPENQRPRA